MQIAALNLMLGYFAIWNKKENCHSQHGAVVYCSMMENNTEPQFVVVAFLLFVLFGWHINARQVKLVLYRQFQSGIGRQNFKCGADMNVSWHS